MYNSYIISYRNLCDWNACQHELSSFICMWHLKPCGWWLWYEQITNALEMYNNKTVRGVVICTIFKMNWIKNNVFIHLIETKLKELWYYVYTHTLCVCICKVVKITTGEGRTVGPQFQSQPFLSNIKFIHLQTIQTLLDGIIFPQYSDAFSLSVCVSIARTRASIIYAIFNLNLTRSRPTIPYQVNINFIEVIFDHMLCSIDGVFVNRMLCCASQYKCIINVQF